MPQHVLHGRLPLILEARRQLLRLLGTRLSTAPHLRATSLGAGKGRDQLTIKQSALTPAFNNTPTQPTTSPRKHTRDLLISDLDQAQPSQVPTPVALGIIPHQALRMAEDVSAEGIVRRQSAELGEHLVRADVVGPGGCHGALEGSRVLFGVAGGGDALNAAELGEGVDAVGLEGFD